MKKLRRVSRIFRSLSTKTAISVDRAHGEQEFELRLSHKPQCRNADSHRRRKDLPQSCIAGMKSRSRGEYMI